jgi:hypothetical protein
MRRLCYGPIGTARFYDGQKLTRIETESKEGARGRHGGTSRPLGTHAVRTTYLDAGLWLRRRADHPRLRRVEDFGPLGYGHHFRLEHPSEIDAPLEALMREAYRVETQELTRRRAGVQRGSLAG